MKNICIWSSPRNVSTALMYSFSMRKDVTVVDEPLYGYYLSRYDGPKHPGQSKIISSMNIDPKTLVDQVISKNDKILWHKMMCKHIEGLNWDFLYSVKNALLIRDPRSIILSYAKVMPEVSSDDIGIKLQRNIFDFIRDAGQDVPILDSSDLLKDPGRILSELCKRLGLEWDKAMLSWEKGPIAEDGIWAKYWYENTHNSTGFQLYTEKEIKLNPKLEAIAQHCMPHYNYLYKHAIK